MIPERKILVITGAGGFLGKGLIRVLEGMYTLRLVDIRDFETPHEKRIGDVADLDFCMEVMKGAHLLLIAHMSPRPYDTPYGPFNVNVTGTANLLFAAQANGTKRACIISSVDAVHGEIKRNGKNIHRLYVHPLWIFTERPKPVRKSWLKCFTINTGLT